MEAFLKVPFGSSDYTIQEMCKKEGSQPIVSVYVRKLHFREEFCWGVGGISKKIPSNDMLLESPPGTIIKHSHV